MQWEVGYFIKISLAIASAIILSGCSQETTFKKSLLSLSGMCLTGKKISPFATLPLCALADKYSCHRRIFTPDRPDGQVSQKECAKVAGLGSICLPIDSLIFNTEKAISNPDADPTGGLPGGEFNYSEYICSHNAAPESSGRSSSLNEALQKSYELCLGGR